MKDKTISENRLLGSLNVSRKRLVFAVLVFVLGVVFANSIAELLVALQNKYSTYPAGTDTSMLFYSLMVARIFSIFVSVWAVLTLGLKPGRPSLRVFVVLCVFSFVVSYLKVFPSFVPRDWCKYELSIYPCK